MAESDQLGRKLPVWAVVLVSLIGSGGLASWLVPMVIGTNTTPQVHITNTFQLPAGHYPSAAAVPEQVHAAPRPEASPSARASTPVLPPASITEKAVEQPQEPVVTEGPSQLALETQKAADPLPINPTSSAQAVKRTIARGQSFTLCGVKGFDLSPWVRVSGQQRQATLRSSSLIDGERFERVITVDTPEVLWAGCQMTLTAIQDGAVQSLSFVETLVGEADKL